MITSNECCFIGVGSLYVSEYGDELSYGYNYGLGYGHASNALLLSERAGNVSALRIIPSVTEHKRFSDVGFGKELLCDAFTVDEVNIEVTFQCVNFTRFKEFFFAKSEIVYPEDPTTPRIVMPSCGNAFKIGSIITFEHVGLDASKVIIKRTDTNAILNEGSFYAVTPMGIEIIGLINFPSGVGISIQYGYDLIKPYEVHEALQTKNTYKTLVFEGLNKVNHDEYFNVKVHKMKFDLLGGWDAISESFVDYSLTGKIMLDRRIVDGDTLNRYYTIKRYNKNGVALCL